MELTIEGIQEAQDQNIRMIAALRPDNAFGRAIQMVISEAHRYAVAFTHVITGSLRAAHRMEVKKLEGTVSIDPGAINPMTGERPADYGIEEHGRGGTHAFYDRAAKAVDLGRAAQYLSGEIL